VLVYGDQPRVESPGDKLTAMAAAHSCQAALIEAGELAQALADAAFEARGVDDDGPMEQAAMALCLALARGEDGRREIEALTALPLPSEVSVKTPEGYAFYGVYPERYAEAAAAHSWQRPPFVIGLRSIGTSLAAAVAATTGARHVITLRPTGHPFRREVRVSPAVRAGLAGHAGPFAVVDEGPGLSGSSFGAAADLLGSLGVAPDRIVFLPSHAGDLGPQASAAHRARWRKATRLLARHPPPLADWFADITGPAIAEEIAGTTWKVRLNGFVARFAGLGKYGEAKLGRAQALHREGFTPEPLALRHGLLLHRWLEGVPARPSLDHLARYLGFRREAFPTQPGANAEALIQMTAVNAEELLGVRMRALLERLPLDRARPRPVHVDGRLHAGKWLATARGLIKLDALDHAQAHDLVGPQDIAWDVAGAEVELGLSTAETWRLAEAVDADPVMLELFRVCYPAFQAGLETMQRRPATRYATRLARLAGVTESAD
jgi:hypothetical protein